LFDKDECPDGIHMSFFQGRDGMRNAGFTLIELLVSVALIGLVLTLAVPAFGEILTSQRREEAARQLANGIRSARTEAILRAQPVVIRAIDGDWGKGWQIIVDPKGSDQDTVVAERARNGKVPIVGNQPVREQVRFSAMGAPLDGGFVAGTLHVCAAKQAISHHKVIMARTGRVRIESVAKPEKLCG
jgi:type IV fimbrial biogenesis protein FimT